MNILEVEDMVKGLPDDRLQQEAEMPTGQVPQFLVVSEIQRRSDMRQRFAERQQQQPQGTVKDQVLQQGIASMVPQDPQMQPAMMGQQPQMPQEMMPPQGMPMDQPPMGMYRGGVVRMAEGLQAPFSEDDPRIQYLMQLRDSGRFPTLESVLKELEGQYFDASEEATLQRVTDEPTSVVGPPNTKELGLNVTNIPMTDIVQEGNRAYDALQQVFMEATMQPDAYSQDAYADIFARQEGNVPYGLEFATPRTTDDLLSPRVGVTTREMAQSQTLPNVPVERPAPSQRGIGSAPEGTADALQAQIQALRGTPSTPAAQADFDLPEFTMPDFASYRQTINAALAPPSATGSRSVGNLLGSDMPALSNVSGAAPSPRVAEEILAQTPTGGGTNVADLINQALAPPPATGGRSVGNLFGSDMPAPSSVDGSAPVSAPPAVDTPDLAAQLIAESQARRGTEPGAAVGTFDAPAPQDNALIEQLIAGSEARRGREPSSAVGDFSQSTNDSPRRQAMLASMERIREAQANAPLLPFIPEGTKSQIIARGRENPILSQIEEIAAADDLARSRERMLASLEGTPLEGIYDSPLSQAPRVNMMDLIKIADNQSGAVQTDGGRGLLTGSATDPEVVETALTRDTSSSLSERSTTVDEKDTSRGGTAGKSVQGTGSPYPEFEALRGRQRQIAAGDVGFAGQEAARGLSFAEMLRTRERPELSYEGLASKYQEQMESQLDEIKSERGAQALIALGAGIARGDLGAGLSDAGKAVATSNAQRRALQARQQAIQMGLEKSQIDAAFANQVKKEQDQIDAMRFEIDTLNKLGVAVNKSEQTILNFDLALESKLASLASTDRYRDQQFKSQDALNRRAALDFVTDSMRDMGLAGKSDEAISNIQDILLRKAARTLQISVADLTEDENQEEESDDQVISFDREGNRI